MSKSEERYRDIAEVSSDWYWEMGADLRYTFVSSNFFEETGYKPEEILGKTRAEFIGPESIAKAAELWRAHEDDLAHHRVIRNFEYFQEGKDGQRRYVRVNAKPFFDENDVFLGYRGSATNNTEQKQMEQALVASEQRFRDFAESASDWLWEMDSDLRFSYFSEGNLFITGMDTETLIGKTRQEIVVDGEDPEKWAKHLDDLENHRPFRRFQYEIKRPDGGSRHISISGKPVFGDGGQFLGYRGAGSDMTPQIEAEGRAASAQSMLIDAIESVPSMMILFDADGRFVMCNQTYRETMKTIDDMLVPGISFPEILRAACERGMVKGYEGRCDEWVRYRVDRLHNPGDPVLHQQMDGRWVMTVDHKTRNGGTLITRTDVTALKKAEDEKRESELYFRALYEQSPLAISIEDYSGVKGFIDRLQGEGVTDLEQYFLDNPDILFEAVSTIRLADANQTCLDMYGARSFEDLSENQFDIRQGWLSGGMEFYAAEFACLANGNTAYIDEYAIAMADDNLIQVRGISRVLKDHEETWSKIISIEEDISERKQAEWDIVQSREQAELANRAKSEFLANMSHELRTPLNAIIGFSDSILQETFGPLGNKRYTDYLSDIHKSGIHLLDLINDILDVSVIEAGKLELQKESLDIGPIIAASVRLIMPRAERGGLTLTTQVDGDLPPIHADKRRLKQILLNLLANAVKFTPAGGTVSLAAQINGAGQCQITVSDTGIGMDREGIATAREKFGRASNSLVKNAEGAGLGLPLTIGLIDAHGGTLEIESIPEQGTTVTVCLPV